MSNGSQIFSLPETHGHIKIRLDWRSVINVAGNYSDVTCIATVVRGASGYNSNSTPDLTTIIIDGQRFDSRHHIGGNNNTENEIARATARVQHNNEGQKSITISFEHYFGVWWNGRLIGNRTFTMPNLTLDRIPRLSEFNVPTTINLGSTVNIDILPKASIFDHRVRFRWHNRDEIIHHFIRAGTNRVAWAPKTDYVTEITNGSSSWGTLAIQTWLNGVMIGETTKVITLKVHVSEFTINSANLNMGSSATISIAPQSSIYNHSIHFKWHNAVEVLSGNVDKNTNRYVWTPKLSYANNIPNALNAVGTLIVTTSVNNKVIGSKQKPITLNVPDNIKPTLSSVTLTDVNNVVKQVIGRSDMYVKTKSDLRISYNNVQGAYGSTIKQYRSEIENTQYRSEGNNGLTGVLNISGRYRVISYVVDSRGRQSDRKITTIDILDYHPPIVKFYVERDRNPKERVFAHVSYTVSPLTLANVHKNTVKLKLFYSETGGHYTLDKELTFPELRGVNHRVQLARTYAPNRSFKIKIEVWDKFTTLETVTYAVAVETLESERIPFALHPNGIMVNTVEPKGAGNIIGDIHITGDTNVTGNITATGASNLRGNVAVTGTTTLQKGLTVTGDIRANNRLIQMYSLTQASGEPHVAHDVDFNTHNSTGFYYKNHTCQNRPVDHYGWLEVFANGNNAVQRFYTTDGRVYRRFKYANDNRWKEWKEDATAYLPGRIGWCYEMCPKGQNFGDFLKSNKVPSGFSIIRDANTNANCAIIKENDRWIFGTAVRGGRFDAITVENGVYKGYRGWNLP